VQFRALYVDALSDYVRIVEETHFTHMRRVLKIKPFIEEMGFEKDDDCEPITMIVNASGLTVLISQLSAEISGLF
jgi:hypothetical protein